MKPITASENLKVPLRSSATIYKDETSINLPWFYLRIRKILELGLIISLVPLLIPIGVLTGIIIKLESPGSVFFTQIRPGKEGKRFRMYKFRSMKFDSDASYLTTHNDQRITRTGKFIRRYRIDEIPQFWNVLKGEMSLIGPRPVPESFYYVYVKEIEDYSLRHVVKPGITGMAQISQGYTNTIEEERLKLKYDRFYINNIGPGLDLFILYKTVSRILIPEPVAAPMV